VVNGHELVQISRVALFWKVMRLQNGVSRRL